MHTFVLALKVCSADICLTFKGVHTSVILLKVSIHLSYF